jgi:hypothetical protein
MRKTASIAFVVAVGFGLLAATAAGKEPEGGPLAEPLDERQLPVTWRNLANERVMFPLDMKDMPVKIGRERQLFLDNYLIAESANVRRQVQRPRRDKRNPIVTPFVPEGGSPEYRAVAAHVMQFKTSPRFRMWYQSFPDWHPWRPDEKIRFASSYAVSEDGIHWSKPDLDLHRIKGSGLRNIVIPYGLMHGVFHEPHEPDPQKRFKALICVEARRVRDGNLTREYTIPEGYYLHWSPDGIHWKGDLTRYIIPSLLRSRGLPQNGVGDTSRFWWDPLRRRYVGDVKFVIAGQNRCRGIMESVDLVHWSQATPTFLARLDDHQIYGHRGFVYQGMYLGMRWVYVMGRSKHHSSNVELDCSRDGRTWTRVGAGQPFMDFNPKRDTWDAGKMRPVAMLEVGEEIWIYYNGKPTDVETGNPAFPESQRVGNCVGLARLPRDRFASINGGDQAGRLTTRPIDFHGSRLHVNATVAEGGELRVEILTHDGKPIASYRATDCLPISGDGIDLPVSWKAGAKLVGLDHSRVRFRFSLKNAKLFSFWVD